MGTQRYARADHFLQEIVENPPSMLNMDDCVTSLLDTTRIAELILIMNEKKFTMEIHCQGITG